MAARKSATVVQSPVNDQPMAASPLKPSTPRKAFRQWSAWRVFCLIAQLAFNAFVWYMPGLDLPTFFRTLAHRFSSPYQFYVVFTLIVFEGAWLIGFGFLYVVYQYEHYFLSNKCALTDWPWNRGEPFATEYKSMIKKAIDEYIPSQISIIISIFVGFWVTDGQTDWELFETKFIDVLPVDRLLACGKLLGALLVFDTIFYWTHYFEHRFLYQYHKIHHEFNHVYPPLTITGTWGHTVDGLLGSVLPAVVPILFFKFDLVTFWQFMFVNIFHSSLDHSGYEFNFCPLQLIPFSGYVDAHTFHHTKNTGNYSLYWAFWDDIMGTNADYKAYVNAQILAENGGDSAAAESNHSE